MPSSPSSAPKSWSFGRPNQMVLISALGPSHSQNQRYSLSLCILFLYIYPPPCFAPNFISLPMDLTMSGSSLSLLFLIFSLHIHFLVPASGYFQPHEDCVPHRCGDQEISYPFRHIEQPNYCGYPGYELGCDEDNLTLSMASLNYQVIHIDWSAHTLVVVRVDLSEDICLQKYVDTTLNFALFNYTFRDTNSTLFYDCDSFSIPRPYRFSCHESQDGYFFLPSEPANPPPEPCSSRVLVPISRSEALALPPPSSGGDDSATISEVLTEGFEITWIADTFQYLCESCYRSGGTCGHNRTTQEFNCFCADGADPSTCDRSRGPASVPLTPQPPPGIFPSSMYPYSDPICGFQLAEVVR
ncbi:hypothetical protein BT93_B0662 [Corymbia citriodora subsp. variegata]|nr:hypothetical protein BT93_B0662 [Corymbia citriodora subsp. variegata]